MKVRPVREKLFQAAIKAAALRLYDVRMRRRQSHR